MNLPARRVSLRRWRQACLVAGWLALPLTLRAQPAQPPAEPEQPTELRADSLEMVSTEEESRALCEGQVVLTGTNLKIVCDRLEIIATRAGDLQGTLPVVEKFKYLLATGNVRIVQGDREATCGRAEVLPREGTVVLTEDPVLLDHSNDTVLRGRRITLFRAERRVQVDEPVLTGPTLRDLGPDVRDPSPAPRADAPAPAAPPAP